MISTLMTATYLEGNDFYGGSRFERTKKWLEYYTPLKEELGFDEIILMDNASEMSKINELIDLFPEIGVIRFEERLEGGNHHKWDYPYIWRYLTWMMGYSFHKDKKVIFMESDTYILSRTLAKHIKNIDSGYETLWCPKYNMSEASFQVLCPDTAPMVIGRIGNWKDNIGKQTETTLPFTKINKDFIGDRYGETLEHQEPWMDYYVQCQNETEMKWDMK